MPDWLQGLAVRYPELALFFVIAAGYWIGNFKFGAFSLGPVTGALFAGLLVGHFAPIPVSGMTKSFLFLLFLFGVGYSVGPQFVQALKRGGVKPVLLSLVVCITGLIAAIAISKFLGLDPGFAAGLLSGALTQSPAMGTATDTINSLALPDTERARLIAHLAVADAVCYIFGYAGVILFTTIVAPALLKIDLKQEALKLEDTLGMSRSKPGVASAWRKFEFRAYRLSEGGVLVGSTVAEAEARVPEYRAFIHRLRRGGQLLEATPNTRLQAGDVLALSGPRQFMVDEVGPRGDEIEDKELLDVPVATADVLMMNSKFAGIPLADFAREPWTRGVYLRSASRGGQDLPIGADVSLERGDLLRIVGPDSAVDEAAKQIGVIVAPTLTIDFVVLGLAIVLGGIAGTLLSFSVAGVRVSLSMSVGVLLAGLLVGHLRTSYPLFGRIPDGAVSLMTSLGLAAFVGLTGINAGPVFVSAVREAGISLLLGGAVVTLIPQFIGLAFGHFVLRMQPILLLGALTGAQTVTAAMAALQERSNSPVAVLGYTPAYPIASILLTAWGTVIVAVTAT